MVQKLGRMGLQGVITKELVELTRLMLYGREGSSQENWPLSAMHKVGPHLEATQLSFSLYVIGTLPPQP